MQEGILIAATVMQAFVATCFSSRGGLNMMVKFTLCLTAVGTGLLAAKGLM
ncbi:MAG: hypothetical protein ABIS14_12790 [Sphingomonas sp.]